MDDALLRIGRNSSFDLFHGEDHILLVLGDLRKKREDEHVDCAGTLPVKGGGMVATAGGDEGRYHFVEMLACQAGNAKVRLCTPFSRHVFLKRGVHALKDSADAHLGVTSHVQCVKRIQCAFPKPGADFL